MGLAEKLQKLKDSQDENAVEFAPAEMMKLYNRFNQIGVKRMSHATKAQWHEIKQLPPRQDKQRKQRMLIRAWVIDPNEGKFFQSRLNSVSVTKGVNETFGGGVKEKSSKRCQSQRQRNLSAVGQ